MLQRPDSQIPDAETEIEAPHPGLFAPTRERLALVAACVLAVAAAVLASTGASRAADTSAEFALLIGAMAIFKTVILFAAGAILWWRLGAPISPTLTAGYVLAAAASVAGATLVWNMAHLGAAPFLFDGGLLVFLLLVLRDNGGPWTAAFRSRSRA
ncbi:hypothetical protein JDN40_07515 [Rhodomicrobium vannielii ATCC 17100]|uniref:hypothetical protein n=1 Tax=Rhodomicrobium vannielii TaxID=1069 RepID=UPI00191AFAD9|nr:hypothetical protein [Rhodomicrobium vannielii]MBJ7533947.1 hypothetical protein [Rhodomicrobium vannielii ATCC 17100]